MRHREQTDSGAHWVADPYPVNAPLLVMEGIEKRFPGVVALDGASLTLARGEVHAIVGQNGAGKSTLIKILNGAYRRDGGTILLDGQPVDFHNPQEAQLAGVSTIYQDRKSVV